MDNTSIGQHISRQYNEELEDIRNRVMAMGGLVEQQVSDAVKALVEGDEQLAEVVVNNDYKVNALEVQIDEECNYVLARRQPAASDLRLVMAVIKTITDLERIGDEAERIARMAQHIGDRQIADRFHGRIEHLGELVRHMLHGALDAFARMDAELAVRVWHDDRKVDREYEGVMRQLITLMMEDARSIPWVLDAIWAARALERVGDRASNICEYVIYLVKGKDVRHTSLADLETELQQRDRGEGRQTPATGD
ncbi:phosphate signaling complex protein PhoU [Thiohalobacter sp. IOR34]|uniref:phosphate signaling complex protein PhoU n=1 Tax=Thiohalobacter sp. IOR34 TaxID=3057176 RepID=UPI0025B17CA7|nr:phosphate signaling complex protein PhoU [Thiohalobacter sp. IOR34]WJW75066.1 phosphate signaling complex protein PhoU [Thiohalobacter sp. IOR34]